MRPVDIRIRYYWAMSDSVINRLRGCDFVLVENAAGHVTGSTLMSFSEDDPLTAHFSGPNVVVGQVLVNAPTAGTRMLYQALTSDGELVAGEAEVLLTDPEVMLLNWRWLTGDRSGGQSK